MDGVKVLQPYLQRAEEMSKHDKRVAYYCRMYALEQGLAMADRSAETTALLGSVMQQLEADKLAAGLASREDDGLHCEGFALKIFGKADALDRSGRSDSGTARALYAAFLFFEVLRQFGELPPDLAAKQKYAAWRAADIRGALKEGRAPGPPPGGEEEAGAFVAPAPPASDCPQPPAGLQPPPAAFAPPPATASPLSAPSPARSPAASSRPLLSATPSPPPGLRPPVLVDLPAASASGLPTAALMAAQVAAKTAASALSFDDVPTAVAQLRAALRALGQG